MTDEPHDAPEWQAISDEIATMLDRRDADVGEALFALLGMAASIAETSGVPCEQLEQQIRDQYTALRGGRTTS